MEKFYNRLKSGAERFSLGSKYVPHFSELQYGEDLYYLKCQLIMHIIESILGETHFFNVTRELFTKSKPAVSLKLFKRPQCMLTDLVEEFGILRHSLQGLINELLVVVPELFAGFNLTDVVFFLE